ncbi:hypothetical protein JCM8097_001943 [Rhodosporidiobolus ruineniae]
MASSSPPPPPDPNRPHPFSPSCGTSSLPSRPVLRRSKTLANPESPTTWRREPLLDVTNLVLGRGGEHVGLGRLQRVPLDDGLLLGPSPLDDASTSSPSPATPSRIPRRSLALRRTRSAAPSFMTSTTVDDSSSPATGTGVADVVPFALADDGLPSSPMRELRPRPGRAGPAPAAAGSGTSSRRARSATLGSASASGGSGGGGGGGAAGPSRRRTFGGIGLAAVLEDPASEDASHPPPSSPSATPAPLPAPPPTGSPRTRARARVEEEEAARSGENERRLRRRRSSGAGASPPSTPSRSGSAGGGGSARRGLR